MRCIGKRKLIHDTKNNKTQNSSRREWQVKFPTRADPTQHSTCTHLIQTGRKLEWEKFACMHSSRSLSANLPSCQQPPQVRVLSAGTNKRMQVPFGGSIYAFSQTYESGKNLEGELC